MARLPEAAKQNSCACLVLGLPAVDSDPFQYPSEHPDEIPRVNWVAVLFGYLRRLWGDRYMASECEKNFLVRGISSPKGSPLASSDSNDHRKQKWWICFAVGKCPKGNHPAEVPMPPTPMAILVRPQMPLKQWDPVFLSVWKDSKASSFLSPFLEWLSPFPVPSTHSHQPIYQECVVCYQPDTSWILHTS